MTAAIANARALLATFRASPWQTLHVRTAGSELFLAKPGGGGNPMRAQRPEPPIAPETLNTITAPHVATFVSAEPVGTFVAAGQVVCRLEVLGEAIEVSATEAGRITGHTVAAGALVDYGAALITIGR